MKSYQRFQQKFQKFLFILTSPLKKLIALAFLISMMYVMVMRKLLIQGIVCNIFDNEQHHPNDTSEAPKTHCRERFSYIYYVMMCCFFVLLYFIFVNFSGSVLFYSPIYYLFSIVNRVNFGVFFGFNVNFVLMSFLLSYLLYMFLYIMGYDEPLISLLDRKKYSFAHSTYVVMIVFAVAFGYLIVT